MNDVLKKCIMRENGRMENIIAKAEDILQSKENIKIEEHSGYIVTLNTLARLFPGTIEDVSEYCRKVSQKAMDPSSEKGFEHHIQTYLTYGVFDRISFKEVERFSRYFDLDDRSKYWLGKHQNLFLYTIKSDMETYLFPYQMNNRKDNPIENDFGFWIRENRSPDGWFLYSALKQLEAPEQNEKIPETAKSYVFPFFVLTMISFSNDVITRVKDFGLFIKTVRTELRKKIDERIKGLHVKYEIYGSLGASELCY